MRCPSCDHDNRAERRFCAECGAALASICAACGASNEPGEKFCGNCGVSIVGSRPSTAKSPSPAGALDEHDSPVDGLRAGSGRFAAEAGERRHLTVLFCDLVNSTEIAARLDPEQWHAIAAQYQRTAGEAVTRLGGHVFRYLGDGLVVYFGYPDALEDAAERAVRGGLAILERMAALNDRFASEHHVTLSVRVGIHTGSVVVAQGGGTEIDMFGDAPNIASRVEGIAAPDTVVMTAAVHNLVSGLFVVEDRGAQRLKGIEQPVQLYRVIGAGVARRRTRGVSAYGQTPFVGREDELGLLLSRWERVREGDGQVVLVLGEPGIGKSRLLEEFHARITPDPHLWIECAGQQLFEHTPFHAVTQMLDQGLGWHGDDSTEERVTRVKRGLEAAGLKLGEAVPLIAEMLDLPIPATYPPLLFSPDQRRKRLFAALVGWVFSATRLHPVVIALEDLQWVDPSTLELFQTLVEQGATARLLLLPTARSEFRAPWPMRAHHAQIALNRLNDRHTRAMVASVAARAGLAKDVIDTVVKRTDGVPLFAEELTRLLLEGDRQTGGREIPATLLDSLTARLDRLGRAKEVAQLGAVLGREFSYEVLHAVSRLPEDALQAALAKLADAELLYARGMPPEATYQFKHALMQDAAYAALLKSTRRDLHRRVAQTMTGRFAALAEAQPQVLARHWSDAGEAEPASTAWTKAARAADARHAYKEAEEGYRQALAMLGTLPASAERDTRELELTGALITVVYAIRGLTAPEIVELSARARDLAEKGGNLPQLVLQASANCAFVSNSGDYLSAASLADQALGLARREGSDTSLRLAHEAQLIVRFLRGDLVGAEEHFARWSDIGEASGYGQLPGETTTVMSIGGHCAWTLGQADSARARLAHATAFARDTKRPFDLVIGLAWESWLYMWLREPQRAEAAATQHLAICDEHAFPQLAEWARVRLGGARAQLGSAGEGVALIRQGLAGLVERGVRAGITEALTCLAGAQALDGAIADALATIEDALTVNPEELVFRPNSLTCRGELRLTLGQTELAEADFREAVTLARTMRAKAFELRATTSLARLLHQQGQRDEARTLLAPIYDSFTEGFELRDLKDAKALLDELR